MAILHILLNINDSTVVGPRISSYKDFFEALSSEMRGSIIAQQMDLIQINNNYEMHHPVTIPEQKASKEVVLSPLIQSRTTTTARSFPFQRFCIKWTDCFPVLWSWVRSLLRPHF